MISNPAETQIPLVLNLTTDRPRYEPDRALVERDLRALPDVLECRSARVAMYAAPFRSDSAPDSDIEAACLKSVQLHVDARLQTLPLVLLLDKWPKNAEDGAVVEPLGVYVPNLHTVLRCTATVKSLGEEVVNELREQLKVLSAPEPVPAVILLMEAIIKESEEEAWSDMFVYAQHSWLTIKDEANQYVENDSQNVVTMRAEAGANWFSWLIGSDAERWVLARFSDGQSEPYRAYRTLIGWASRSPCAPGAQVASAALNLTPPEKASAVPDHIALPEAWVETLSDSELRELANALPQWLGTQLKQLAAKRDAQAAFAAIERMLGDQGQGQGPAR
jgi:hypothetical protein